MSHIDYDGGGELHITGINEAAETDKTAFDRVITTCQESIEDNISDDMEYSFYCMSDGDPVVEGTYGGSCEYEMFEEAADELYTALSNDETVLIHCHCGVSRSVSVATAALGRVLGEPRSQALDIVHYYRPVNSYPEKLLMEHASKYIKHHTDIRQVPFSGEVEE